MKLEEMPGVISRLETSGETSVIGTTLKQLRDEIWEEKRDKRVKGRLGVEYERLEVAEFASESGVGQELEDPLQHNYPGRWNRPFRWSYRPISQ